MAKKSKVCKKDPERSVLKEFGIKARTANVKNHSMLHKAYGGHTFIEFKSDFLEAGLESLDSHLQLAAVGLSEIEPRDRLLVYMLREYGLAKPKIK